MTTYNDKEFSIADAEPFELYDFVHGTWTMYLTTRATEFYVSDNQVYLPTAITRGRINQGEKINKDSITITIPRGHDLAAQFINFPPETSTTVTIRRLHRGLAFTEAIVIWKGRVIGGEPKGETMDIICESIFTSLRRYGLRLRAELICQHTLYSPECGANQPLYRFDNAISAISGTALTMASTSAKADGWFNGGILDYQGDTRFILFHAGNTIKISRPMASLKAGITVALYPGCDRTMDICKNKFGNLNNYLGFPWIPSVNPFEVNIT